MIFLAWLSGLLLHILHFSLAFSIVMFSTTWALGFSWSIFSKDVSWNAHHSLALTAEKSSLASLAGEIKTNSSQRALCLVHAIPFAWNTFPSSPHLVNAYWFNSISVQHHYFREASGTFSTGSHPQFGALVAHVHHLIALGQMQFCICFGDYLNRNYLSC